MAFESLTKVRAPLPWWQRIFMSKKRRQTQSRRGIIAAIETGQYSKQPVYTVLFEDRSIGCFFEDQLELVRGVRRRQNDSGETLH